MYMCICLCASMHVCTCILYIYIYIYIHTSTYLWPACGCLCGTIILVLSMYHLMHVYRHSRICGYTCKCTYLHTYVDIKARWIACSDLMCFRHQPQHKPSLHVCARVRALACLCTWSNSHICTLQASLRHASSAQRNFVAFVDVVCVACMHACVACGMVYLCVYVCVYIYIYNKHQTFTFSAYLWLHIKKSIYISIHTCTRTGSQYIAISPKKPRLIGPRHMVMPWLICLCTMLSFYAPPKGFLRGKICTKDALLFVCAVLMTSAMCLARAIAIGQFTGLVSCGASLRTYVYTYV
jgi:hypothetical protein